MDLKQLSAPFPPSRIEWRVGSTTADKAKGMALAYIDARAVMERLDSACGPEGWQCRYPHAGDKTCCEIGIKVGDEWVWKADGAGDTDFEGDKGAFSDAFKRAAVRWGIGRYLYDVAAPWVAIEQRGKTYVIKQSELGRLEALLPNASKFDAKGNPENRDNKTSRDPDWHGPLKKVELQANMRAFFELIGKCDNADRLQQLIDEYAAVLDQCRLDQPGWMTGDGMPEEFVPGNARIEAKRRFLNVVGA